MVRRPRASDIRYRHLTRGRDGRGLPCRRGDRGAGAGQAERASHYHVFEEEHVYHPRGRAHLAPRRRRPIAMKAGDYVCFPAGQKAGHCLINDSGAPCRYVIVGEHNPNEVAIYTDSSKCWSARSAAARSSTLPPVAAIGTARTPACRTAQLRPSTPTRPADPAGAAASRRSPRTTSRGTRPEGDGRASAAAHRHLTYAAVGEGYHVGVLIEAPAPGMRALRRGTTTCWRRSTP